RPRTRHEVAAVRAPRGRRAAERRSNERVALSRPERPRQHDDPGAAAPRTLGIPAPAARASHGRRAGAPVAHPDGGGRATRAVTFRREPAEGLPDATVP